MPFSQLVLNYLNPENLNMLSIINFLKTFVFSLFLSMLVACVGGDGETTDNGTNTSNGDGASDGTTGDSSGDTTGGNGSSSSATNPGATLADLNNKNGAILSLPDGSHKWYFRHQAKSKFDGDKDTYRLVKFTLQNQTTGALLDSTVENGSSPVSLRFNAPTTIGSNNCDENTQMSLSISGGNLNGSYTATACTIQMDYVSKLGALEGTVKSVTFKNDSTASTLSLKDIPFRIYSHVGKAGAISTLPDSVFATMNIGSTGSKEIGANQYFELDNPTAAGLGSSTQIGGLSPDDGTEAFTGNASDRIVLVGQYIKGFNVGSQVSCSSGYQKPNLFVYMGTYQNYLQFKTSESGGSCTIEKTANINGFFTATYTATLIHKDLLTQQNRQIDVNGKFKNYAIRTIEAQNGDEGALASSEYGVSFKITDGSGHFSQNHQFKNLDELHEQITKGSTNFSIYTDQSEKARDTGMTIREIPMTVGNYNCGDSFTSSVAANIRLDTGLGMTYNAVNTTYDRNTQTYNHVVVTGASCSINVTSVDTSEVVGNFSATLLIEGAESIMPNNDNQISLTGSFRKSIAQ